MALSLLISAAVVATPNPDPDALTGAAMSPATLQAPVLIGNPELAIELPLGAEPKKIIVELWIATDGRVEKATVLEGTGDEAQDALLRSRALEMRFTPGRFAGRPVRTAVTFAQLVEAELPPVDPLEASRTALLSGLLRTRGTSEAIDYATIVASVGDNTFEVQCSPDGHFEIALPPGRARVEVEAPGYRPFRVQEELDEAEHVEVVYLVERASYSVFETVIRGERERQEVSRVTLEGRELRRVPGTFGDPFRVIQTLPGVVPIFSLLSYPLIRGSSPGNSAYLLDGVPIPQLFHLLGGPAVIAPAFVERIDFYPGSFPVTYGGYTGGVIDGITRRTDPEKTHLELDASFTSSDGYLSMPLNDDTTLALAGRYGYPGFLLGIFAPEAILSYWDYQARLEKKLGSGTLSFFAFGAFDELGSQEQGGPREIQARSTFHRFDAGYFHRGQDGSTTHAHAVLGFDDVLASDEDADLITYRVVPRIIHKRETTGGSKLRLGVEGQYRQFRGLDTADGDNIGLPSQYRQFGTFFDFTYKPTERLALTPGLRADAYQNERTLQLGIDPRFLWRYHLIEGNRLDDSGDTWLKGGVGIYRQPPRFFIPLPGFEELALERGLLRNIQSSVGVEYSFGPVWQLNVETYFQFMKPIYFDLTVNDQFEEQCLGKSADDVDVFLTEREGRSYGLEVLLKRKVGKAFGWVSYTLSRSERLCGSKWRPFDFDRRHVLNVVAGVKLPRDWEIGFRALTYSGRPVSRDRYNDARGRGFYRLDLRVDRTVVYDDWIFEFYVDIINTTVSRESFGFDDESDGDSTPYLLPTIGVSGRF